MKETTRHTFRKVIRETTRHAFRKVITRGTTTTRHTFRKVLEHTQSRAIADTSISTRHATQPAWWWWQGASTSSTWWALRRVETRTSTRHATRTSTWSTLGATLGSTLGRTLGSALSFGGSVSFLSKHIGNRPGWKIMCFLIWWLNRIGTGQIYGVEIIYQPSWIQSYEGNKDTLIEAWIPVSFRHWSNDVQFLLHNAFIFVSMNGVVGKDASLNVLKPS